MRTYIKIQFSSEGAAPTDIIHRLEELGWKPVVGEYDFVMEHPLGENVNSGYRKKAQELHNALQGTNVRYSLTTK